MGRTPASSSQPPCYALQLQPLIKSNFRHVICIECTQHSGFSIQLNPRTRRNCLVCSAELMGQDDAVLSNLNPSEQYKSNILSGLGPNIIMECAGRAINFWSYQTAQEAFYQNHLCKILKEKCTNLHMSAEAVNNETKTHIDALQREIRGECAFFARILGL